MDNHFVKFAFLAAMIGAVLFSRMAYPAASSNFVNVSAVTPVTPPTFVMPSIAVSARDGTGNTVGTNDAPIPLPAQVAPPPLLDNAASLVVDIKTKTAYEAVNADERWPTASLAKLMSATIVLDKLDPKTKITITETMFAADPQELTLVVGGTYTVSDLLHLMLLPSSNVAAEAAATFYGRDAFIAEMNARATEWGMTNTHYDDPSGISAGDQSTANDLAKLAEQIYENYPQIFQITRAPQYTITEQNSGKKIVIKSIDDFAGQADFYGGKTGHTDQADGNLLSVFRDGKHMPLIIVLGSSDRFGDSQKLYDWFKANIK